MSNPVETPPTPQQASEFDFQIFWLEHGKKLLLYGGLLLLALAAFGGYELWRQRTSESSATAYAKAKTVEDFRKVAADFGGTPAGGNALLRSADLLREEGKLDESSAALRQLIEKQPEHPLISGAYLSLGVNLEMQNKLDEALSTYQKVTTSYPSSFSAPLAWLAQGRVLKTQGKKEEAQRALETVVTTFPENMYVSRQAMAEMDELKK